jgi:hypothetical protein
MATLFTSGLSFWLSRDPIEERGGLNILVFIQNEPIGRYDLFGLVDVTMILGPDLGAEKMDRPKGEKLFWEGSAETLQSQVFIEDNIIKAGQNDFNSDRLNNPEGKICQLDINWIICTTADPLTLNRFRRIIGHAIGSDGLIIYNGHGYIREGESETRTVLVDEYSENDRKRIRANVARGGLLSVKGTGYTWTEILRGVGQEPPGIKSFNDMVIFCCYAKGLPDRVDKIRLIRGPTKQFHDSFVYPLEFQDIFKKLVKALCCKKLYNRPIFNESGK